MDSVRWVIPVDSPRSLVKGDEPALLQAVCSMTGKTFSHCSRLERRIIYHASKTSNLHEKAVLPSYLLLRHSCLM